MFIYEFLSIVAGTPNFAFSLEFLGPKEMELIGSVVNRLSHLGDEQREELCKVFKLV